MRITASKLRENLYRVLDEAIATGVPVEVVRNNQTVTLQVTMGSDATAQ